MRLNYLRAGAVTKVFGWQSMVCRRCVDFESHKKRGHGERHACRFAPVAIDKLNLSELYVARQPV
jgi:hypothetical protein